MASRALKIPKRWGQSEPDWLSFLNFYKAHVKQAVQIAKESAKETDETLFHTILNNTLSHIAYCYEEWCLLTSEQKLPYVTIPEYKAELEKRVKEAKNFAEQAFQKTKT